MGTMEDWITNNLPWKEWWLKEKKRSKNIKGTYERYESKQLPTYNSQHLKHNPTKNNVESIYNVYLQHHPIKVNI
jgi:hypothetical protein